ncbi:MAG TPA: hypothetical protein VKH81_25385 [Candidatus Angelobacter sp.]|nr:hypothetical protein [Candidatus Angelobacter sp.]
MLLVKIIIAPVLIGLVSLAGRKWGPGIAGWLLGLPLNSGPILLFLLLQEGHGFASAAAVGSLLGIIAWAAFGLVYALCCPKLSWWASMLAGWAGYAIVAFMLLPVHIGVVWSFVLVVGALAGILLAFPRPSQDDPVLPRRKYELWLRMITATIMVVTLTAVAKAMGPQRSGILTAFPAYTTIIAVFSHHQSASSAIRVLRGVTMGLYTAATFFLVLSTSLVRTGAVLSFTLALAAAALVQLGSFMFVRRGA